jgi:hypothetical protein
VGRKNAFKILARKLTSEKHGRPEVCGRTVIKRISEKQFTGFDWLKIRSSSELRL